MTSSAGQAPWEAIKLAVAEAMELAPTERAQFLELRCKGDHAILNEALSLVEAATASDGILNRELDTWLGMDTSVATQNLAGRRIGRYTLTRVLGEGAAGVVYLASQDSPERTVAVKLLRSAMPLMDLSDRFRLEAAALGRIRHPSVAQIYEAGVHRTESGAALPYIAMEYIAGQPITEFVRDRNLTQPEILRLMVRVAEAIHAAHQRAVIHRDLKPSNVLVDEAGQPKVVDFGIARINEDGFRTRLTAAGSLLGTPGYMSPEQAVGSEGDTDVRTDVWSLGALLYELLTGRPPMDIAGLTPTLALRRLIDAEPVPIRKALPSISRDLECVVMTALARARDDRYPSAQALADDLTRLLADEPISVRPPSRAERAARFVRRHRAGVLLSAGALTLILGSAVALGISRQTAAAERDRARAVNALLQGMISAADPNFGDRNVTMLGALTGLESRLTGELAGQPRTEADVRSTLGVMLFSIAEYDRSREHLTRAIELRRSLGDHAARLEDQVQLANTLRWLYLPDEAQTLIESTESEASRRLGAAHPTTIHAGEVLAGCAHDLQRFPEAETAYRSVIARATQRLGPAHEQTLFARSGLASVLIDAGRYADAEQELRAVIDLREATGANRVRETLTLRANLALTLAEQGHLDEAIAQQRLIAERSAQLLGPTHDSTVSARTNLAESLRRAGRADEALHLSRQVYEECAAQLGWAHESTLDALEGLAMSLVRTRQYDEALALATEALQHLEPLLDESSDWLHRVRSFRAAALAGLGRFDEASQIYAAAIDHYTARYGPEYSYTVILTNNLGLAHVEAGDGKEAVDLFRDLLARTEGRYDSMQPVLRRNLGHALMVAGQLDEARAELTAARDASLARGEAENAERCNELLAELETRKRGQ